MLGLIGRRGQYIVAMLFNPFQHVCRLAMQQLEPFWRMDGLAIIALPEFGDDQQLPFGVPRGGHPDLKDVGVKTIRSAEITVSIDRAFCSLCGPLSLTERGTGIVYHGFDVIDVP